MLSFPIHISDHLEVKVLRKILVSLILAIVSTGILIAGCTGPQSTSNPTTLPAAIPTGTPTAEPSLTPDQYRAGSHAVSYQDLSAMSPDSTEIIKISGKVVDVSGLSGEYLIDMGPGTGTMLVDVNDMGDNWNASVYAVGDRITAYGTADGNITYAPATATTDGSSKTLSVPAMTAQIIDKQQ